jgi:TolB-like protein
MRLIYEIMGNVTEPDELSIVGGFTTIGQIGEPPYFTSGLNEFFMQDFSKVNDYKVIETFFRVGLNKNNRKISEFNIDYSE